MGDFSMTCSASGLGIAGGTPVRCLLLTESPYKDTRRPWIVRTPPLRAVYSGYGTVEHVHEDDDFIAKLWRRGLREDLIDRGTKNVPPFDELLTDLRNRCVEVRQDAKHFWRRTHLATELGSKPQEAADPDKCLTVGMAMIREDVWQALAQYPRSEIVTPNCIHCGQVSWEHAGDRRCPNKAIEGSPLREPPGEPGADEVPTFLVAQKFHDTFEYVVVPGSHNDSNFCDETIWYDLAAYKASLRVTWKIVLESFTSRDSFGSSEGSKNVPKEARQGWGDAAIDRLIQEAQEKECIRVSKLSAEEKAAWEVTRRARIAAVEREEKERREHPHFGDFLIRDSGAVSYRRPGAWILLDAVPGVIGPTEHLSMCLSDKLEVPLSVLDALAELSAVGHALGGVRVPWRPSESTGPQYPEWAEHVRFAKTVAAIAQAEDDRTLGEDPEQYSELAVCATLAEVQEQVRRRAEGRG